MAKAHLTTLGEGGTPYRKKCKLGMGDTTHTFLMGGSIGVGTPLNIEKIKVV